MTLTAVAAGAYLHHIALLSDRPEELASFYAGALDMDAVKVSGGEWRCTGPGRRITFLRGKPRTLAYAGIACRDADGLDQLRDRVVGRALAIKDAPGSFFESGAFAVDDPDGNTIAFGLADHPEPGRAGLRGPIQHLSLATFDVDALEDFYCDRLGFAVSDRVRRDDGEITTSFVRSNHEHHTMAFFKSSRQGIDHHSYEAGEWNLIRDWADRFATLRLPLVWGPGRHGPGNNLFIFIEDPDGNRIEVSAELEVVHDRPVKDWSHEERTLNLWGSAIMRA
jgi:catechol 2,3-dioxygenase-like lactoylglutathione lyase family enzyme